MWVVVAEGERWVDCGGSSEEEDLSLGEIELGFTRTQVRPLRDSRKALCHVFMSLLEEIWSLVISCI